MNFKWEIGIGKMLQAKLFNKYLSLPKVKWENEVDYE